MKMVFFLSFPFLLFCLPLQSLSSTWGDSELMKVVNQRLSTPFPPRETAALVEIPPSLQRVSKSRSSSSKTRRTKDNPSSAETHASKHKIIKSEQIKHGKSVHDQSKKVKQGKSEIFTKANNGVPRGKRKLTEIERFRARQRMQELWAPGGARRVAFENKRDESIRQRLKAPDKDKQPSLQQKPSEALPPSQQEVKTRKTREEAKEPIMKPKSKSGIKIEPQEDSAR